MSLRLLGRLFAFLSAIALALALLYAWQSAGARGAAMTTELSVPRTAARGDPQALAMLAAADVSRGAVLARTGATLVFDLPPTATVLRLLLNPGLIDIDAARYRRRQTPDLRWRYVIQSIAYDAQGQPIEARKHHFRRDLTEIRLPDGTPSTGAFYLERGAPMPLRSNELRLDFTGLPRPARLELRLLDADVDIAEVLVRVSAPFPATLRNPDTEWQRLTQWQRSRLAAGNALPAAALTPAERRNLIASRWQVVSPRQGAAFRDLHVLRETPTPAAPPTGARDGAANGVEDGAPAPAPVASEGRSVLARSLRTAWSGADRTRHAGAEAAGDSGWARTEALFARLLQADRSASLREEARALGWTLRRGRIGDRNWTVLQEAADRRMGRGVYAFSDAGRHAIQAPHVPTDLHTGEIALAFAHDGAPRAVAWNTVTRREADLVHLPDSAMHAFSRAFATAFPRERIVQLHGYHTGEDRPDLPGGAIVSASRDRPGHTARSVAACMRRGVEPETGLYGIDTEALGGERNRIARALRESGYQRFIHLEMSLPLREALLEDESLRRALLDCLEGSR
jgi:hypothetical protein